MQFLSRPTALLLLTAGLCALLAGCRPTPPPAVSETPTPQPPPKPHLEFVWLASAEAKAAEGLLAAPDSAEAKQAFLTTYRKACQALQRSEVSEIVPVLLRLWEWSRAARVAHLPAAEVRKAIGWGTAKTPPRYHPKAGPEQAEGKWRLATPQSYDADVRKILRQTKTASATYADFVARWVRYIVVVNDAEVPDPNLPLRCQGTADPLSGTVFLAENDRIFDQRRPSWKIAAALVHQAERIAWYYDKAGTEARLLYPLPDERNAYLGMFEFGRKVMESGAAGAETTALRGDVESWREVVRRANAAMGYPADDLSVRTDLNVSDAVLETDPATCPPGGGANRPMAR